MSGPHTQAPWRAPREDEPPLRQRTVLHVLGVLDRGGVERRTLELLAGFRDAPVRFVICTLSGRAGELAEDYRRAGATVVPVGIRSPAFPLRFLRLLARERVDVVHSHVLFASGYLLALAALRGVRVRIAHFNSDSPDEYVPSWWRRLRYAVLKQLLDGFSTRVVGVAPSTLDANWGPRWREDPRASVLPSGIDLTAYVRSPDRALRRELGIGDATSLVLHLGRADIPTKNRELAVEVVAECRRRGMDVELAFVGRDGSSDATAASNRAALQTAAAAGGVGERVHFLGERSDVADALSSSDALLFTSRREGLPGVLLEAVACGTPVVSSDVPGAVYIAQQVDGVEVVGLSAPVDLWADALAVALHQLPPCSAGPGAHPLEGSVFDLERSLASYSTLWGLS